MFQIINSFIEGELTDEWVAKNTDYTTVDDYRESIRSELEKNAKESAQEVLKNTAWSTVLENSEVKEYPQEDVDKAVSEFKKSMEVYAKQADMTLEEFTDSQGISQDDFDEQCQQYAEGKVKQNLIVQGIMDAEGLSLDDKESLQLQDKLVEKEYLSAKLYYDLGSYTGNTVYSSTGNNYLAAVVTAQNILREYPYTQRREDLSILILRAKYDMAKESVLEKKAERMRETIDEYYAFKNEFPDSKYMKEVEAIFKDASKYVNDEN